MTGLLVEPAHQLAVAAPGGIKLTLPHPHDRDPQDVATFELRFRRDVDAPHVEWPVETYAAQRPMRLLAEVAASTLVQRHGEALAAVRAQPRQGQRAPEVPAQHG